MNLKLYLKTSLFMKWGRAQDKVRRYEKENFQIVTIWLNVELSWKPLEKKNCAFLQKNNVGKQKGGEIESHADASDEGEDDEKTKKCKPNLEIGI